MLLTFTLLLIMFLANIDKSVMFVELADPPNNSAVASAICLTTASIEVSRALLIFVSFSILLEMLVSSPTSARWARVMLLQSILPVAPLVNFKDWPMFWLLLIEEN